MWSKHHNKLWCRKLSQAIKWQKRWFPHGFPCSCPSATQGDNQCSSVYFFILINLWQFLFTSTSFCMKFCNLDFAHHVSTLGEEAEVIIFLYYCLCSPWLASPSYMKTKLGYHSIYKHKLKHIQSDIDKKKDISK